MVGDDGGASKRQPGSTSEQRAERNQLIRTELAKGHSFARVAERFRLSERQVRTIWDARRDIAYSDPSEDPRRALQDELEALDALIAECAERGEASENDSVWLGSVNTRLKLRERRLELMRLYGLLPWGYDQLDHQRRTSELIELIVAVLARHNVSEPVFDELAALTEHERQNARQQLTQPVIVQARPAVRRRRSNGKEE